VKLKEIASLVNGEILGDESIEITGASGFYDAKDGDITFIASNKFIREISKCKASSLIVKDFLDNIKIPQIKVQNPYIAFIKLLNHFYVKPREPKGLSKDSYIPEETKIGNDVSIYPFVYISENVTIGDNTIIYPFTFIGENTIIGKNCLIYPNVVIREDIKIGDRVIIHSGTVIGSDGFGYIFDNEKHQKIPQVGGVIIEDDVEIGANVTIDRATTGNTIISKGTKIDNLVQIAHNVKIGKNTIIVAQVGIAGSSEIGDNVTLAGQVGISDHSKIESETIIGAQSGTMGYVKKGIYTGTPAIPHKDWLKSQAIFTKLPEIYKKIKEFERKITELERRILK
jgi:UDP-3-O-[3-hydroxymyristoyl] glucosamine N-acyltransferase